MRKGSAVAPCCRRLLSTAPFHNVKSTGMATAATPTTAISTVCFVRRPISKVFYVIKLTGGALVQQARDDRSHVGRPLAQPAHEVREPLAAERDVDADARAAGDQRLLKIAADAVEQLELVPVAGDAPFLRPLQREGVHRRIVRRKRGI